MTCEMMVEPGHLESHKTEDEAETIFEIVKLGDHSREDEIQGPESQDGKDIGGEDDEGFLGDGKDGRDTIQGKNDVRYFDKEKGE